jgi:O-antigen ligase
VELIRESALFGLLRIIAESFRQSKANELCGRLSGWLRSIWSGSAVRDIVSRQGRLSCDWDDSFAFRILTGLLNAIPWLLKKIDRLFPGLWDKSVLLRAVSHCGDHAYVLLSWFFLGLLVVPYEYWNNAYSLGAMLLTLILLYAAAVKKPMRAIELNSIGVYAAAFAAFVLLFFLVSTDRAASARFFSFHVTCMLAVVLIVNAVRSEKELMRIIDFSMAGLLVSSIYATAQRMSGIEVNPIYVDLSVNSDMPGRVFSFFQNPNAYAMLLVLLLPVAGALVFFGKGKKRLFYALVFGVSAAALMMTYSRGAWAGFILSIFVFALIMRPILVPELLVIGILLVPLLPETVYNRIMTSFNTKDTSITSRKPVYRAVWQLIAQNPVFGAGLGSDTIKSAVLHNDFYRSQTPYIHAHSLYLELAAETGVFGLLAFLGALVQSAKNGLQTIFGKQGSRRLQAIIAACIAAFAGILLCGIMDYPWSFPRIMVVFWYVFALLLSAVKLARQQ